MLAVIRKVERDNDNNYGVHRVYQSLNGEHDTPCGRSRVQRIMHENGMKAKICSKYKPQTTKADPNEHAFPNLLKQQFNVKQFNKVWLTDITYIRVNGKWTYLAAVMDLARRKIVGWAMGMNPNAELACRALWTAVAKERPSAGLIHHSDRGCQYTSKAYRQLLAANDMIGSMSRKGVPGASHMTMRRWNHSSRRSKASMSTRETFKHLNRRLPVLNNGSMFITIAAGCTPH